MCFVPQLLCGSSSSLINYLTDRLHISNIFAQIFYFLQHRNSLITQTSVLNHQSNVETENLHVELIFQFYRCSSTFLHFSTLHQKVMVVLMVVLMEICWWWRWFQYLWCYKVQKCTGAPRGLKCKKPVLAGLIILKWISVIFVSKILTLRSLKASGLVISEKWGRSELRIRHHLHQLSVGPSGVKKKYNISLDSLLFLTCAVLQSPVCYIY